MRILVNKFLLFSAFFMNFSLNTSVSATWSGALCYSTEEPTIPSSEPSKIGSVDVSERYLDMVCLGKCNVKSETLQFSIDASTDRHNLFEINNSGTLLYAEHQPVAKFTMPDFGTLNAKISLISISSNSTEARKYVCLGVYKSNAELAATLAAVLYMPDASDPSSTKNKISEQISGIKKGDILEFVPLVSTKDLSATNATCEIGAKDAAVSGLTGKAYDFSSVFRISIEFSDENGKKI